MFSHAREVDYPEGIKSLSPGLRRRGYPGLAKITIPTPKALNHRHDHHKSIKKTSTPGVNSLNTHPQFRMRNNVTFRCTAEFVPVSPDEVKKRVSS